MKVCMVTYSFYESDTRVMQYVSALIDRGDSVDVIALRQAGQEKVAMVDGATVYRVQERQINEKGQLDYFVRLLGFFFRALLLITKKQFTKKYDFVHVHSVPDFLIFSAIFPKMLGIPLILDIHDLLPEFYASKFKASQTGPMFKLQALIERLSVGFADRVIVANPIWSERVGKRTGKPEKCFAIGNFADPRIFAFPSSCDRDSGDKFLITFPGSLNWHQGVDVAIRAFARVAEQLQRAEFHIYGEGPEKLSLMQLVRELKMEDKIQFHPFLPTIKIAEIMAKTNLAVVPKRASSEFGNEAASTKIMEFMSLGVPLIVSKTKIDSFYFDDKMVCFFESENEADLASKILLLHEDKQYRKFLTENALDYVARNGWGKMKAEYYEIVNGLSHPSSPAKVSSTFRNHPN